MKGYSVKSIEAKDAYPYLLDIHYAARIPSISYTFGLFASDALVGVITYGTPFSAPLRKGVLGPDNAKMVLELNRLCLLRNLPNEATYLIAHSLKLLPRPLCIISFADPAAGHEGTVYQAANFIYTGLSAKRKEWKVKGREHIHSQTIADEFRKCENRIEAMRLIYGDDFYTVDRPRKHRYVTFVGSATQKKTLRNLLRYPVIANYPKSLL